MLFWPPIYFLCFRKVYFDLIVEKEAFISGMEMLEEAVSSFLHICFVTNMHYPVGSGNLSTYLQRYVAKLDENGTTATRTRKDQVAKEDKAARSLKKVFEEFNKKMYVILSNLDWLHCHRYGSYCVPACIFKFSIEIWPLKVILISDSSHATKVQKAVKDVCQWLTT